MELLAFRPAAVSQSVVMLLQMVGVLGLVLFRALPSSPWCGRGKAMLVLAVVGLGLAGVLNGQHQSATGLFAGATVAFLMVGLISGTAPARSTITTPRNPRAEAGLPTA